MHSMNCIIIEDEKPAQEILKSFIAKTEWINLVATFDDAVEALDFLKKNDVDAIFLDIQMPGITGIDFLRILKNQPQVIITTAYSQYAIEAFELDVRDYLIKPFSFDRFLKSVNRINSKPDPNQIHQLQQVVTEKSFSFFNVNKMMVRVTFDDIRYVESMREYVYIHNNEGKIVTKMGLGEIEKMLGPGFLRIHRSYLINLNKIAAFNAEEVIIEKTPLPIGTNYKKLIEEALRGYIKKSG
jgi:two-component system, LytTR family, response regulator